MQHEYKFFQDQLQYIAPIVSHMLMYTEKFVKG